MKQWSFGEDGCLLDNIYRERDTSCSYCVSLVDMFGMPLFTVENLMLSVEWVIQKLLNETNGEAP